MRAGRAIGVLACCLCVVLASCTGAESGTTTIRFWTIGREGEVVEQLLPEFERAHPGVRIDVQQIALTAAHEKLLTAFAGDALPDVSQLGNTWIPELATLGALEPLQERVDTSAIVRSDDYFPGIWDTNVIDGKLYGVPWYVDTRLLFYRSDILAEAGFDHPPRDWDEWRRAMAAVKANVGAGRYAVYLPLNEFEPLLNLALEQAEPLLRDNGTRGNFRSVGFHRAVAFYVEMFAHDWAPEFSNIQMPNVWDEFARGFVTFYISGPWNIGEFLHREPQLTGRWMTAPLPGPDGVGTGAAGGSSLVIFHGSKNARLAWELVEYLSATTQQQKFYALTGDLPPRRSAWEDPKLAGDPYARAFREQLERAKATPKVPEWERIVNEMQLAAERIVRGHEPTDRALEELDARTDAILEKRRWILAGRAQ